MGISVLTAAAVSGFIELATVKSRLGITGTDQDVDLRRLIGAASGAVVARVGDPLVRQQYRETLPGRGKRVLQVHRWPVDPDSLSVVVNGEAVTDFEVEDAAHGWLYRAGGWPQGNTLPGEEPAHNVAVTYRAGYVPPAAAIGRGSLTTWAAEEDYVLGSWVRPSSPALSPLLFECTTAGASGASEPTWPDAGEAVTDGTAVWTGRRVEELPSLVEEWTSGIVYARYKMQATPPGLASREVEGFSESYFATHVSEFIPPAIGGSIDQWRANR